MRNRSQDCIQDCVEIPRHILGEEAEDEETVFLKPAVFAPVASVGDGVGRVLRTIEFHGDPTSAAEHVDFCAWARRLFRTPPALSDSGRSVQQPSGDPPFTRRIVTMIAIRKAGNDTGHPPEAQWRQGASSSSWGQGSNLAARSRRLKEP
jgi:hypothetical protein